MKIVIVGALAAAFTMGCAMVCAMGCAIRKDLASAAADPMNKPALDDQLGGGDPSLGTKFCAPGADGKFPADAIILTSGANPDASAWAEGGGCVMRPIRETWAALNNLEAMRFAGTDSLSFVRLADPGPQYIQVYDITYYKSSPVGSMDWILRWYHGVGAGTFQAPTKVNVNYERTGGYATISVWNGGIVLTRVNATTTSMGIRNTFKATQSNDQNLGSARDALSEMVRKARTVAANWDRLNAGQTPPPVEQPPAPVAPVVEAFCKKDANGKYPEKPEVTDGLDGLASWVNIRTCVSRPIADVLATSYDHEKTIWQNASKEASKSVTPLPSTDYRMDEVTYTINSLLPWAAGTSWTMDWEYQLLGGPATAPESVRIPFGINGSSPDFPTWKGTLNIALIEPGVTAVDLHNEMLLNEIDKSPKSNQKISQKLIDDLTGAP